MRPTAPTPWLADEDGYLQPFDSVIRSRHDKIAALVTRISAAETSLASFASSYRSFGWHRDPVPAGGSGVGDIRVREWLPGAQAVFVFGDFNVWRRHEYPLAQDEFGVWRGTVPGGLVKHGHFVKLGVVSQRGEFLERVPAWITRCERRAPNIHLDGVFWEPPAPHVWRHERLKPAGQRLRIYEAHIGMCTEEGRVGTYDEFRRDVLPHVARLGYNALQLMGIMEHPYYGSFGYQVSSFFAASSRFGTPEQLKALVDAAHGLGVAVLLDLVHSHACANVADSLNELDGTTHHYFHEGGKGRHPQWDSRLFDYSKWEVLRFLLSNVHWWAHEYRFDGFRFDGVTSMLYTHHGIGRDFSGGYPEYFGGECDEDAIVYLGLANMVAHELGCVTMAEDVSGYPGIARPFAEGGLGFDYRLHMAVADRWIKLLKHARDEDWDVGELIHVLTNRRAKEKHVVYSESHDQSLVGDKTVMMWLADSLVYTHMSILSPPSIAIDRAVALHKLILSLSWVLGGDAVLNFCGNEFGHPEWVDFPRAGNNESYHHARRQWSLARDPLLRYGLLLAWNKEMLQLDIDHAYLATHEYVHWCDVGRQIVVASRPGGLLWAWNFSHNSYTDIGLPCPHGGGGCWRVHCSSDDKPFGGHARVQLAATYGGNQQIYLPSRTVIVLVHVPADKQ